MQFAWHLFWTYSYYDVMQCTTTHILHLSCILFFFCHDLGRCHRAGSDLVACCFTLFFSHVESPKCAFSFPFFFFFSLMCFPGVLFCYLRPEVVFCIATLGFAGFFPSGLTDWTSRRNVIGDCYNLFLFYTLLSRIDGIDVL